jgi:hypothetical protein
LGPARDPGTTRDSKETVPFSENLLAEQLLNILRGTLAFKALTTPWLQSKEKKKTKKDWS